MFRTQLAGEIRGFRAEEHLSAGEVADYHDRYLQYAIASSRKAMRDAGLAMPSPATPRNDIALVLGTCNGGLLSAEEEYSWKHGKSDKAFDEATNLQAQLYGFGKALSGALGITGETWVVTTACSSTTVALGVAQMLVNRGLYKVVLVGGSDSLCLANLSGFDGIKATSGAHIAPYSVPEGLNVGEASVFWVVEEMESALLRSARCLARLVGHATSCDAYHPTSPDPRGDGAFRTLKAALDDTTLELSEIGCINTHGTGTAANDRAECKGIARLCGERAMSAVSLKSFFGHCMGTAGILEATSNILAMNAGFVPPTINHKGPRPGCESIDCVPNAARELQYDAFVSANYAFGGNNAAVAISSWDHQKARPRPRERQRVVITGGASVTSLGLGTSTLLDKLERSERGFTVVDLALGLTDMRSHLAGLVPQFKGDQVDRRIDFTAMNTISRYATAAARMALDNAGLRVDRRLADSVGIAMGVCNGPNEAGHMDSVFTTANHAADINSFSNVVANSTAGWTANALMLRGVNATVSPGHHAGLQALAYAWHILSDGRAEAMIAAAADEVYRQTYFNYDLIGFLYQGEREQEYRLRFDEPKRKVLGEGAAALVMETLSGARARGATVLAEVLGYGMTMDGGRFHEQNLSVASMTEAVRIALSRSGVEAPEVDLVVWAPQGNAQDRKVIDAIEGLVPGVPLAATTFNTGYIEAASILVGVSAALESIRAQRALWPQVTGCAALDGRTEAVAPRTILACGSSDLGYNFAAILRAGHAVQ